MDIDAIPLGSEFRETINRAVASCDVLIALIGRDWLDARDADGRSPARRSRRLRPRG
jgi:hypothetical protein